MSHHLPVTMIGESSNPRDPLKITPGASTRATLAGISLTLPWPSKHLHSNARAHWSAKAAVTAQARGWALLVARAAGIGKWPEARIEPIYYPPNRRGNPHNVAAALKPYLDGIADAMGYDDRGFRVTYPEAFAGTRKSADVVFHITPGADQGA